MARAGNCLLLKAVRGSMQADSATLSTAARRKRHNFSRGNAPCRQAGCRLRRLASGKGASLEVCRRRGSARGANVSARRSLAGSGQDPCAGPREEGWRVNEAEAQWAEAEAQQVGGAPAQGSTRKGQGRRPWRPNVRPEIWPAVWPKVWPKVRPEVRSQARQSGSCRTGRRAPKSLLPGVDPGRRQHCGVAAQPFFLPKESFSVVIRLNTGCSGLKSWRSATK